MCNTYIHTCVCLLCLGVETVSQLHSLFHLSCPASHIRIIIIKFSFKFSGHSLHLSDSVLYDLLISHHYLCMYIIIFICLLTVTCIRKSITWIPLNEIKPMSRNTNIQFYLNMTGTLISLQPCILML